MVVLMQLCTHVEECLLYCKFEDNKVSEVNDSIFAGERAVDSICQLVCLIHSVTLQRTSLSNVKYFELQLISVFLYIYV